MTPLWDWIKRGYVRLVEPIASLLVRHRVHPNVITTLGTCCSIGGGIIYGAGHIRTGGWFLGLTALFDVIDGDVARRTGLSSVFGAFYDSTLDRVADAAVLAGLAVFYATSPRHASEPMLVVCLAGIVGGFLVSYTRARAEALGVNAKVGFMQRPSGWYCCRHHRHFSGWHSMDGFSLPSSFFSPSRRGPPRYSGWWPCTVRHDLRPGWQSRRRRTFHAQRLLNRGPCSRAND
jgi:CDP-diacylglycerol--glycerol-3-phosphate 3-phosphatidyltransferase